MAISSFYAGYNYYSYGSATAATNTDAVWVQWNSTGTAEIVSVDSTNMPAVWVEWNEVVQGFERELTRHYRVEMPVQTQEELERQRIEREAAAERYRAKEREHAEAQERALRLLKETLTAVQLERFERDECIPVDTEKGNKYIIHKGRQINIWALTEQGEFSHKLCAHPEDECPDYDTMLAQKLFLETCEDEFLAVARRH